MNLSRARARRTHLYHLWDAILHLQLRKTPRVYISSCVYFFICQPDKPHTCGSARTPTLGWVFGDNHECWRNGALISENEKCGEGHVHQVKREKERKRLLYNGNRAFQHNRKRVRLRPAVFRSCQRSSSTHGGPEEHFQQVCWQDAAQRLRRKSDRRRDLCVDSCVSECLWTVNTGKAENLCFNLFILLNSINRRDCSSIGGLEVQPSVTTEISGDRWGFCGDNLFYF